MHSETTNYRNRYKGIGIVYGVIYMTIFAVACTLAADYGRVQLANAELQKIVDASARAGVSGVNLGRDANKVNLRANEYAIRNSVDGNAFDLKNLVVEKGDWDQKTRKFTKYTGADEDLANAVRVTATTKVGLAWAHLLSSRLATCTVRAEAIATLKGGPVNASINGKINPYLSGMPDGIRTDLIPDGEDADYGDTNFIKPLKGIDIVPNSLITFTNVSGKSSNDPNRPYERNQGPDGEVNADRMFTKWQNMPEFGMSPLTAPPNAMIAVFLGDEQPNLSAAPTPKYADCPSDYTAAKERNRETYRPKLKQMFFVGDGKTDNGKTQTFIAPEGATRMFIGSMDEFEWNNNHGGFKAYIDIDEVITLVK